MTFAPLVLPRPSGGTAQFPGHRTEGTITRFTSAELAAGGSVPSGGREFQSWLRLNRLGESPLDPALEFKRLADEWHEETDGYSSYSRITGSQPYLEIATKGRAVVPYILQDLAERGGFWYPLLKSLTGEWPVPAEANGIPRLMKEAWLEWGRRSGYLV